MSLRKEFRVAVSAGETALRINTDEIDDALKTIGEECKKFNWELRVWDMAVGEKWFVGSPPKEPAAGPRPGPVSGLDALNAMSAQMGGGPATPVAVLAKFHAEPAKPDKANVGEVAPVVLVMKNFHRAFEKDGHMAAALVQRICGDKVRDIPGYADLKRTLFDPHQIAADSDTGKFVVGLMPPESKLPPELVETFKRIDHELPDEAELRAILDGVLPTPAEDDDDDPVLSADDKAKVCKFALGLTRHQAEGVFGSCMVEHGKIVPQYVWAKKSDILNKEGLVTLYDGTEKFKDVSGLDGAKSLLKKLLTVRPANADDPECRAKGVLLCGAPGTGKSLTAKAAGNEMGLPTLMVHPGNWMGSYVGESEAKTRKGFQIVRAHAPCIAVIDEIEKVMPKSRGAGGDSGVGARMEGTFLTNLNDIKERVFWVFTANDTKNMHEAFFRAERVDAVFYVPLPDAADRAELWKLYGRRYFPKEVKIGGQAVPFDQHMPVDLAVGLEELKKVKKVDPVFWANRLTLALLATPEPNRDAAVARVRAVNENVAESLAVFSDRGWSPAEIKSCCRLSRLLEEPLTETKTRVRPVSVTARKVIEALEEWAEEAALDARTGRLYQRATEDEDGTPTDERVADTRPTKVRRKVRRAGEG